MKSPQAIHRFLSLFRRRILLRSLLHTLLWALLVGAVFAVAYAIGWRWQGREVPLSGYLIVLFWVVTITGMWTLLRSLSKNEAAQAADQHFGLKDGISSTLQFSEEERSGEIYDLQQASVANKLGDQSPNSVPLHLPWKVAAGAGGLIAVALWLGTLPNSAAVKNQLQQEQLTLDKTVEVKAALEELMEEFVKDLDEDEKAEVDVEEMREWLDGLEETKDQKEALRQLARFEQKLANTLKGLEAREDEQTLKLAAAELAKSDLSDARQLGKKLDEKDFEKAALDLKKLKPGEKDPKGRKMSKEERKEMMKKLREATKRMANGAKNRNNQKLKNADAKKGNEMQPLDEMLDELDEAAEELEQMQQDMEKFDGEIEEGEFDEKLEKLAGRMKKLDARKKLRGKLKRMRSQVSKAQSFAAGGAQKLGLAKGKGGLPPGKGSQKSNRQGETEMPARDGCRTTQGTKRARPLPIHRGRRR